MASTMRRMGGAGMLAAMIWGLAACGPTRTGDTYGRGEVQRAGPVEVGRIVGAEDVPVEGAPTGIGTVGGAVAGGVVGSAIGGRGYGGLVTGVVGAIGGALAGQAIERGATGGVATRFYVQRDGGGVINVVQTNEAGLQVGERVLLLEGGGKTRLAREGATPRAPGP